MERLGNDLFAVEYSADQNNFHVCLLSESIYANRCDMYAPKSGDYRIVAIFDTREEATEYYKNVSPFVYDIGRKLRETFGLQSDSPLVNSILEERHGVD